jgi:hypothetical protein
MPAKTRGIYVHVSLSRSHMMHSLKPACLTVLQVAAAAFVPSGPPEPGLGFDGVTKAAASSRHALRPMDDATEWTEDAAMYRTGVYGGPTPYVANAMGGAQRQLRLYYQDAVNSSRTRGRAAQGDAAGEATCTKYQNANRTLSPGVLVRYRSWQTAAVPTVRGARGVLEHASDLYAIALSVRFWTEVWSEACMHICIWLWPLCSQSNTALCAHQPTHLQVQVSLYALR